MIRKLVVLEWDDVVRRGVALRRRVKTHTHTHTPQKRKDENITPQISHREQGFVKPSVKSQI